MGIPKWNSYDMSDNTIDMMLLVTQTRSIQAPHLVFVKQRGYHYEQHLPWVLHVLLYFEGMCLNI